MVRTQAEDDFVLVLLEGVASRADHTLQDAGHGEMVRQQRAAMRAAIEGDLGDVVEEATGRPVRAMLSDYSPEHDATALVFLLERRPTG